MKQSARKLCSAQFLEKVAGRDLASKGKTINKGGRAWHGYRGIGPDAKLPFTCGIVCTFSTFLRQSVFKRLPQYDKMLIILRSHEALPSADPPPWIRMKPRPSWHMASVMQRAA